MRHTPKSSTPHPRPAPATRPSVGKKLEAETQNPVREPGRSYRGAKPGYGVDEVLDVDVGTGKKLFRTPDQFVSDSDDPESISAELAEAGADEPGSEPDMTRDDAISEDREFELSREGTQASTGRAATDIDADEVSEDDDLREMKQRARAKPRP